MLDLALIGSAFLMGVAGSVHCVAMCAAPCAAVTGGQGGPALMFQAGRMASYAAAGAVAASSIGLLWQWEQAAAWLRPLWLALHLAVLALGLWLLWRGEPPGWMQQRWRQVFAPVALQPSSRAIIPIVALPRVASASAGMGPGGAAWWRPAGAGLAWVAWPCGLLQSALLVAALATRPTTGGLVMAAFALGSSPGLLAGPWTLRRLVAWRAGAKQDQGTGGAEGELATGVSGLHWATRLSGLLLTAAALWALGHGLWLQIRAYCG